MLRCGRAEGDSLLGRAIRVWSSLAALCLACSQGESGGASQATPAQRGKQIYANVCVACHNADPSQPGSLGPPLAGASQALLEAKILRGQYPPGYTPSRPGQTMPRFEHLKDQIGDLAAYLEQD
jgi:mono/diheme cytochrome c family protein